MKALVLVQPFKFEMRDVPLPAPDDDELLVRVKAVGICGSDVHGATGKTGRRQPPVIMGHEAAGVIEGVGGRVSRFSPGDRITFDSTIYCGECSFCRRGAINLCDNRRVLGVSCDDYRCDGAMAEYVVIPERIAYHIPETLSFPEASIVEALSIAVHAAERTPLALGDTCAVVGAGMIGLLAVRTLKMKGCTSLIALDIDDERLELARHFGADVTVNLSGSAEGISSYYGTANAVIEAVGIEETVNASIMLAKKGGTIAAIGNIAPSVRFPLQQVVTREIHLNGSCASAGEYPACINLIASGMIDVKPLISAVVPLEEGINYFDTLIHQKEKLFKVILTP